MEPLPLFNQKLLIIGGTGRNVGKTSLALLIIQKFISFKLLGLKVSTHKKGEESFHGAHIYTPATEYCIKEEDLREPWKDTAKMKSAGAKKAFYIETAETYILEAYTKFSQLYNRNNYPIVCESKRLQNHIKPGVFIILTKDKTSVSENEKAAADIVYISENGIKDLEKICKRIQLTNQGWVLDH